MRSHKNYNKIVNPEYMRPETRNSVEVNIRSGNETSLRFSNG